MHTFELYTLADGSFRYRVYEDGALRIDQDITPRASGFVPMTEADATTYAQADVATLSAPAPEPEPVQP